MKLENNRRIIGFLLIALIMTTGGSMLYAAVPHDTLRTTAAGVTTQVVDYLNATNYYRGATNVTGYILNADPLGDANFSSVEADDFYIQGLNRTDALYYPQQPASYIIWTDGSTYYAKNGITGAIDYSGADAATIIQSTIDTLHSLWGGIISIKEGNYSISSAIQIYGRITIKGSGTATTILRLANNADCNLFEFTGNTLEWFFMLSDINLQGNKDNNAAGTGIYVEPTGEGRISDGILERVISSYFDDDGIYIHQVWGWRFYDVITEYNDRDGIVLYGDSNAELHAVKSLGNGQDGLDLRATNCRIIGGEYSSNTAVGIYVRSAVTDNHIIGARISANKLEGVLVYDDCDRTIITDNTMIGAGVSDYLVRVRAGVEDTVIVDNYIQGSQYRDIKNEGTRTIIKDNPGIALIDEIGVDTKLYSLTLSFVEGSTLLSSAPLGWEIDANTEYAVTFGTLPEEVQCVVRWKIWATSLVAEGDAMRLEIEGYGGTDNEPYTQETVAVADKPSGSTNFAANDGIYWLLTSTDDTDIDEMFGGDQIMIKILHEIAGGDDCETDAVFTCILIEYV